MRTIALAAVAAIAATTVLASCTQSDSPTATIINVDASDDIQSIVDSAHSGDVILLAPGEYTDPIVVTVEGVTIRGADRNTVILDGGDTNPTGIMVVADHVTVENLTVRHWTVNGVFFTGSSSDGDADVLTGFRIRYVTAYNNGLYGLYSFMATNGTISDSYVSGHPDSGIYVGQCNPCNTVIERVTAENNAIGFEGTNASNVWVINSTFSNNRIGITPNSQSLERLAPQGSAVIAGNIVADNNNPDAPEQASGGFGLGIAIGGGISNTVIRNKVTGNAGAGIVITTLDSFAPSRNVVEGNVVEGNGIDLGYWTTQGVNPTGGNCFTNNTYGTSTPADIEQTMPCTAPAATVNVDVPTMPTSPPGPSWSEVTPPAEQPTMPGPIDTLPDINTIAWFTAPNLDEITAPT